MCVNDCKNKAGQEEFIVSAKYSKMFIWFQFLMLCFGFGLSIGFIPIFIIREFIPKHSLIQSIIVILSHLYVLFLFMYGILFLYKTNQFTKFCKGQISFKSFFNKEIVTIVNISHINFFGEGRGASKRVFKAKILGSEGKVCIVNFFPSIDYCILHPMCSESGIVIHDCVVSRFVNIIIFLSLIAALLGEYWLLHSILGGK